MRGHAIGPCVNTADRAAARPHTLPLTCTAGLITIVRSNQQPSQHASHPLLKPSSPQNTKALHRKLRSQRGFDMCERAPRMLPHAYEPQRMDVAVEHTPEKVCS